MARLEHGGRTDGLLAVCVPSGPLPDDEEQELLAGVAGDVAFALHAIESERSLRQSEERLRQTMEQMLYPLIIFSPTGDLLQANQAFLDLFGVPTAEGLVGRFNLLREPLVQELGYVPKLQPAFAGEVVVLSEVEVPLSQTFQEYGGTKQSCIVFDAALFPVRSHDGEVAQVVAILRDVTERCEAEAALRDSERRYRLLAENLPDVIWTADLQLRFTYVSPSVMQQRGFTPEEVLTQSLPQVVTPSSLPVVERALSEVEAVVQSGDLTASRTLTVEQLCRDGSTVWTEITASLLRDEQGEPVGILGVTRDISERLAAERALRESEERFRAVLETAQDAIFIKDADGRYAHVNPALARLFGRSPADFMGRSDEECFGATAAQPTRLLDERVLRGEVVEAEQWYPIAGERHTFDVVRVPMRDATGRVTGLCGIARDITERTRAQETQNRLAAAIEQATEAVVITDTLGVVQYVNPAFERITGYAREETVGRSGMDVPGQPNEPAVYAAIAQTLGRGEAWQGRIVTFRKDGSPCEVEGTLSPVRDAQGRICNHVGVLRDVTQETQLERQVQQLQRLEAIGRLAGGVAHDFNNLLAGILGHAELLRLASQPGDPVARAVDVIEAAAQRAAQLTAQLLGFARQGRTQTVTVDINQTIQEVVDLLGRTIDKSITVHRRLAAEAPLTSGDPAQMQQVVLNLAINARDAMPEGGELTFATEEVELDPIFCSQHAGLQPGPYVVVTVADTGCGIPEEVRGRIFEPFVTTKEPGEGTGMGLAMVYGIVKNHGGAVTVYSEVGRGTTFHIYLPAASVEADEGPPDWEPAPVVGAGRILVVDDEDVVRNVVAAMLRHLGYDVVTAADGQEAVEYYQQRRDGIDLVLVDMMMPRMGGRDCFRALRDLDPAVRVVISSGYGLDGAIEGLLSDGVLGFVQKPYRVRQLSEVVAEALER